MPAPSAPLSAPLPHMELIGELPRAQQRLVFQMLETVLAQQGR